MTQNLDWDMPTGTGVMIEAANTDLTANQTNLTITGYTNATGVGGWSNSNDTLQYYNPGLWVYTMPTESNNCGAIVKLSDCTGYGWKEYEPEDDEHYLVGNYYSWAAATAGTGKTLTADGAAAPGSICPEKWKLSFGGSNTGSGSFYYLLDKYGYKFKVENGNTVTDLISSTEQNIISAPFYFLRGGSVFTSSSNGVMGYAGYTGSYWSRNVGSSTGAYDFNMNPWTKTIYPSFNDPRYHGYSIRCLVI